MAQPIPQALAHLVALNVEFGVLICIDAQCKYALQPSAMRRHVRDKHQAPKALWKQVQQYVDKFPFTYDHWSVALPQDGSALQASIPIVDGFVCHECAYKTRDHSNIRKHANQVHNKKRVADEEIFKCARLQSWFGEKRERYWVVDEEHQRGNSSNNDEEEEALARVQQQARIVQDVGEGEGEEVSSSSDGKGRGSSRGSSRAKTSYF